MTDGSKQGNDESARSHDRPDSGRIVHDDLPDILEIFGSDPLVKGAVPPVPSAGHREAHQDEEHGSMWDPMASPGDEVDTVLALEADGELSRRTVRSDPPSDGVVVQLSTERSLSEMRDILQLNEDRLGRLEATIQDLAKQTNFLPPKLRGLGKKVDELSTSVGDARLRSLLADVVGLGDLAEGALRAYPQDDTELHGAEARRFFDALSTRVGQILEAYDLQEIPTDAEFDPTVHNAIDVKPVTDEALDGQIIDVVRRGYRSEHSVLRYAEVTVGRHEEQPETEPVVEPAAKPAAKSAAKSAAKPAAKQRTGHDDDISSTYAPFLGASGTAEDSKNLTKRGTKKSSKKNQTTDNRADAESGVEPPSA
jgi:molecular chaperone GrpE (heat shock protein)